MDEIPKTSINTLSPDILVSDPVSLSLLEKWIGESLPCSRVRFQSDVTSVTGEPEFTYYEAASTHRKSRIAKIYYGPHGVILLQEKKYEIIPLANVRQATIIV